MAVATGTAMMVMAAAPLVMSGITSIFSFFKGRKTKKRVMAQMEQVKLQQQMQIKQMMAGYQNMNVGAVNGMNRNYMMPQGMNMQYGMAPQGYYPPGMQMRA